jgi:exopolysaccharide biosynthesis predicted pyruvyltransferase EpsI
MGQNLAIIPEMKEQLSETVEEFKTFKTDHETYEKMIEELKDNLKEHCAKDKQKQKMALDMARQTLLNEMEKAIKEKEVTVSRKAVIGELYDSYEACGGNGAVHDLWKEFVHLPLK